MNSPIESLSKISSLPEAIKSNKPKTRLGKAARLALILTLLTPGSFAALGAGVSYVYKSVGSKSPQENRKWFSNPDQTELKDEILKYAKEMILPVTADAANNMEAETMFRYRDVLFHLVVYPGKLSDKSKKHYSLSADQDGISFWHEGVWPE